MELKRCRASLLWACLIWAHYFGVSLGLSCRGFAGFAGLTSFRVSSGLASLFTSLGFLWLVGFGLHVLSLYMPLSCLWVWHPNFATLGFWGFSGFGLGLHFFSL